MSEGHRQKQLRKKGWIANSELGAKQMWRKDKSPKQKEWVSTGEAIRIQGKYEKAMREMFRGC
jgi:hypothetical protein